MSTTACSAPALKPVTDVSMGSLPCLMALSAWPVKQIASSAHCYLYNKLHPQHRP